MYFVIANIPATFHSKDLRNFFSFFTELNAFECYHYYHRKASSFMKYLRENKQIFVDHHCHECTSSTDYAEIMSFFSKDFANQQKSELPEVENEHLICRMSLNFKDVNLNHTTSQDNLDSLVEDLGYCTFAKVKIKFSKAFKFLYHRKCWVSYIGEVFPTRCLVFNIDSLIHAHKAHAAAQDRFSSNCKYYSKSKPGHEINLSEVEQLKEFQMGLELPCGNVGTSGSFLKSQLQLCKLPSSLIKKLGLDFQSKITKKCHNQVHLDYGTTIRPGPEIYPNTIFTGCGHLIPGYFDVKFNKKLDKSLIKPTLPILETTSGNMSDDEVEKWDKYDEVYEDQRHREMSKDKLFESEMEQVWEKGGSGLVFWTDAQFWRVEDNESEESDADDWDVEGDNHVDVQDKTSINFLKDVRLNPGSHSVFTNNRISKKNMNKYVRTRRKMSESASTNQNDHGECLKVQSNSLVKRSFKKVTKLETKDCMNESSRKEKSKKENAVDQRIAMDLLDFKQNDNVKKKKICEDNFMVYGEFERYSKGIGSRLLKSQGWQEGEGLGKNSSGIVHPVNLCAIAKQHMKREGIGFSFSRAKILKGINSSTSNQLPAVLDVTVRNRYEPVKSYMPTHLAPKTSKVKDQAIFDLKVKEHELINESSHSKSEINSIDSKPLHGLNVYPYPIRFQKASLGSFK